MQASLFDLEQKTLEDVANPETYKGIYSFHKYWGKKPMESVNYFIQRYTAESDIIMDPFLGSGFLVREGLRMNRRVIGIDLNPFAIEHTQFLLDLPSPKEYITAIKNIENNLKEKINNSYMLEDKTIASHYLWNGDSIKQIWSKQKNKRTKIEIEPTLYDINLFKSFCNYSVKNIRDAYFFTNSRINSYTAMTLSDVFTGRALRNIDLIIDEIKKYSGALQRALYLTLTSSSGQMSSMVFAITNRGKTQNKTTGKIEVGSWVIGFWRPELHFEINVWNCFESRAKKLYNALRNIQNEKYLIHDEISQLFNSSRGCYLANTNCLDELNSMPDNSVKLVCTDPPHSDRIPYLELSEIWNSILNKDVSFEKEIVVSNAKERNKKKNDYTNDMGKFIMEINRILKRDGIFLLYFNSRDKESWKFMEIAENTNDMTFVGAFPLEYSATSVVQDNRKGGMKTDYILLMKHKDSKVLNENEFSLIPGWTKKMPTVTL
jgi:SAM-dependent methyltransferase